MTAARRADITAGLHLNRGGHSFLTRYDDAQVFSGTCDIAADAEGHGDDDDGGVSSPAEDTKQDEFVKEVQALKSLHHPKLIQLLAMCSRGEPVYIVTELMSKGSLKSYLACECDPPVCRVLSTTCLSYRCFLEQEVTCLRFQSSASELLSVRRTLLRRLIFSP